MNLYNKNDFASSVETYSAAEESKLILSLYTGIGTANFWEGFMERFAALAGFSAAMVASANLQSGEMKAVWCYQVDMKVIRDYIASGFASSDDLVNHCMKAPPDHFYSHHRHLVLEMDTEKDSEVYREWVAPQGIQDVAIALLDKAGNWSTVIALYRQESQASFSEAQLHQFDRLIPHIRRALWLQGDLLRNQRLPEEIERWMSIVKVPLLLFDEQFNCCEHNAVARDFFARQQELRLEDGRLALDDAAKSRQLGYGVIHCVKVALGQIEIEAQPKVVQLSVAGCPTTFVFIPIKSQPDSLLSSAGALVFIHQRDFNPMLDFSPLQAVFGLTDAELLVASRLAQGDSIQEIASTLGKSRETVRSQLKQVFSKTATSSQTELVLTLLTHPMFLTTRGC